MKYLNYALAAICIALIIFIFLREKEYLAFKTDSFQSDLKENEVLIKSEFSFDVKDYNSIKFDSNTTNFDTKGLTELQIKDKRIVRTSGLLGVMRKSGGLSGGGAYGGIQDDNLSYSSDIGKRTSSTKKYFINPTEELINENHNQTYISETTLSTFSIDVDTASYRKIKKTIDTTTNLYYYHFAPEEIRIEEMINYTELFCAVTAILIREQQI